jgi:hypothetical protein
MKQINIFEMETDLDKEFKEAMSKYTFEELEKFEKEEKALEKETEEMMSKYTEEEINEMFRDVPPTPKIKEELIERLEKNFEEAINDKVFYKLDNKGEFIECIR